MFNEKLDATDQSYFINLAYLIRHVGPFDHSHIMFEPMDCGLIIKVYDYQDSAQIFIREDDLLGLYHSTDGRLWRLVKSSPNGVMLCSVLNNHEHFFSWKRLLQVIETEIAA